MRKSILLLSILLFTGCANNNTYVEPISGNNFTLDCYNKNELDGMFHWDMYSVVMIDGKTVDFGFGIVSGGKAPKLISEGTHKILVELQFHKDNGICIPCTGYVPMIINLQKNRHYRLIGKTREMDGVFQVWIEDVKTSKRVTKVYTKDLKGGTSTEVLVPIML